MSEYRSYSGRGRRRRHRRGGGRSAQRKGAGLPLAFIMAILGAAALASLLFPEFAADIGRRISGGSDLRSAFSALGEGLSGKRDLSDAAADAYSYAFHGYADEPEGDIPFASPELSPAPSEAAVFVADTAPELYGVSLPVSGEVSACFGESEGALGYGTLINTAVSTEIHAFEDGTVTAIGDSKVKGRYLLISHNGVESEYSGLGEIYVQSGDTVSAGDVIAVSGSSDVLFELITDDGYIDPRRYVSWS